jgi:hypothetical protein
MNQPNPFLTHKDTIKAFVLGCDPTAFTKIEKEKPSEERKYKEFKVVFDIGVDKRYFAGILANLEEIGLGKETIYVQNLVTDYQKEESSKNKNWLKIAQDYIAPRMKEYDEIDPSRKIPVLLTSELLYKALLNKGVKRIPAKEFYALKAEIPIHEGVNQLKRPLIPFYRHLAYSLSSKRAYTERIKAVLLSLYVT